MTALVRADGASLAAPGGVDGARKQGETLSDGGGIVRLLPSALFVDATAARIDTLRAQFAEGVVTLDEPGVARLEQHGVLGLVHRNVVLAGLHFPNELAPLLARRLDALDADAARARSTTARFLAAARERGCDVLLLKGSSLLLDVYGDGALRGQGDVDVLVRPADLKKAIAAGKAAEVLLAERQLPVWWYRLVHFHLKLHPATALRKEIEVHWRLASPALLVNADPSRLWERAVPVEIDGERAWVLDPIDRYLHLVTHLHSHGLDPLGADAGLLRGLVADPDPPLRLKWFVDLAVLTGRFAAAGDAGEIVRRARAWCAEEQVASLLAVLEAEGLLDEGRSRAFGREVAAGCGGTGARRETRSRKPNEGPVTWIPAVPSLPVVSQASGRSRHAPDAALDFRLSALRRLGPWMWPPLRVLAGRYRVGTVAAIMVRPIHALLVLGRAIVASLAFPMALVHREACRRSRRARFAAAFQPDAVFAAVQELRRRGAPPS